MAIIKSISEVYMQENQELRIIVFEFLASSGAIKN